MRIRKLVNKVVLCDHFQFSDPYTVASEQVNSLEMTHYVHEATLPEGEHTVYVYLVDQFGSITDVEFGSISVSALFLFLHFCLSVCLSVCLPKRMTNSCLELTIHSHSFKTAVYFMRVSFMCDGDRQLLMTTRAARGASLPISHTYRCDRQRASRIHRQFGLLPWL